MSTTLAPEFHELLAALHARQAEYLLVGAHAMAVHGRPRPTPALDVWVRPDDANAPRVFAALADFGAPLGSLTAADLAQPGLRFSIGAAPLRIDVLTSIAGMSFDVAWEAKVWTRLAGLSVSVISRTHLVQTKLADHRPQDLEDIGELLREDPPPSIYEARKRSKP